MGVLNVTPDSFAEAAPRLDPKLAIDAALQMEATGADLIDVGGESTRPESDPVSTAEELSRVLRVVHGLAGRLRIPVSVDTYKAVVARAVLGEGAALINDISGLRYDRDLAGVVAETGAGLVLMHMRGRPKTMYLEARYDDLMAEVGDELRESIEFAAAAGVSGDHVIVDPGVGFAKRSADSYGVLAGLPELASALDRPILVGPSRKSFMRAALEDRPVLERDWGTAAAVTAAVLWGAHIVRVHNVQAMTQVVRVAEEIRKVDVKNQENVT
jgi:dihydropteroate synthase